MIPYFSLRTGPRFLFSTANRAEPGSLKKIRNFLKYQFQQGNSLLIRKKLILKNKKSSCVEGVSFEWIERFLGVFA